MITVVDYGMGNLRSVSKALERLGAQVQVTSDPAAVERAKKLILPGVGAFGAAMTELEKRRLIDPIRRAIARGVPFLGICLGLQLLFEASDEAPGVAGLGVLPGRVRRFEAEGLKIPHMGWNQVYRNAANTDGASLLDGLVEGSYLYFVHSYYADPADRAVVALESEYGGRFPAMIAHGRLFATQFHPEKSQAIGLRLLERFVAA